MIRSTLIVVVLVIAKTSEGYRSSGATHNEESDINLCRNGYNNNSGIQCFCTTDSDNPKNVKSAECQLGSNNINEDSEEWTSFSAFNTTKKITFLSTNVILKFVPAKAIQYLMNILQIYLKNSDVKEIKTNSFSHLRKVEEIDLSNNNVKTLESHAFFQNPRLTKISLDRNDIQEINRDVFVNLPRLHMLYLSSNNITIIHDKAFVHLKDLEELELNRNHIYSLNNESFAGLSKLRLLHLDNNELQVIGDNTFSSLHNLEYLNLGNNKIQMIDSGAFNGLVKLNQLSLASNKLATIDNDKIFQDLTSLKILNIRNNTIVQIKQTAMEPILNNFYDASSKFDFEDNKFPCDCRLDWFLLLKNYTKSTGLQLAVENMKCIPDAKLSEEYKKRAEDISRNSNGDSFYEETNDPNGNNEYEYYDESQLKGVLFYVDLRDILNCTFNNNSPLSEPTPIKPNLITSTTTRQDTYIASEVKTTKQLIDNEKHLDQSDKVTRPTQLPNEENTHKTNTNNYLVGVTPKSGPTPSIIPTIKQKTYKDERMASDEAIPEKVTASVQKDLHGSTQYGNNNYRHNNASRGSYCTAILAVLLPILGLL